MARISQLLPPVRNTESILSFRRLTFCSETRAEVRTETPTFNVEGALYSHETSTQRIIQAPTNIMDLNIEDRARLLAGPTISIIANGNLVIRKDVWTRALMASSTKMYILYNTMPIVTQFRVPHNVDLRSIERLLDLFTTERCLKLSVIELTSNDFSNNVLMYHACLALGVEYTHTIPLLDALRAEVTAHLLTFAEMNVIVDYIPCTHRLFKHLTKDLCKRRRANQIVEYDAFEEWLSSNSKEALRNAMMEIDQERERRLNLHIVSKAAVLGRLPPETHDSLQG